MSSGSFFHNRNVLITGGLGFIGSTLARRLVELDANVTILDSLIPEYGGNLFNIAGIENRLRINISDVRDPHSRKRQNLSAFSVDFIPLSAALLFLGECQNHSAGFVFR